MEREIDNMLSYLTKEQKIPEQNVHNKIINLYDNNCNSKQIRNHKLSFAPAFAIVCSLCFMLGGITAYAVSKGMTVSELFNSMWSNSEESIVESISGNYEIISETNTIRDYEVKLNNCVYVPGVTYLIFEVQAKDGKILPKNVVLHGGTVVFDTDNLISYSERYIVLNRNENSAYIAYEIASDLNRETQNIYISHITVDNGATFIDKNGKPINNTLTGEYYLTQGLNTDNGEYSLNLKMNYSGDKIITKVNEIEFEINELTVVTDDIGFDYMEKMTYDSNNYKTNNNNASIVLKNGKHVSFEYNSKVNNKNVYVLYEPIDVNEIEGIKFGDNIYNIN